MRIMVGRRWCSKHGHSQDLKSKDSWLRMNKVKKIKYCTFEVRCHDLLVIWIISNGFKKETDIFLKRTLLNALRANVGKYGESQSSTKNSNFG